MIIRLLLALLVAGLTGLPAASPAAPLAITLPLGSWSPLTLTLTNPLPTPQTVRLFEALPAVPRSAAASAPLRVPVPDFASRIDPALVTTLARASHAPMLVFLRDQADLSPALLEPDWAARGALVVRLLQDQAAHTQQPLITLLEHAGYAPRPFWIVNALWLEGDARALELLAARPEVAALASDASHTLAPETPITPTSTAPLPWGLERIGAPAVWDQFGTQGGGITVATIDTGAMLTHPALLHAYRGWSASSIDNDYNWFDPTSNPFPAPSDATGHGSHTMGTIVGGAAGDVTGIGVAPGARWIAARGCYSNECRDADLIASAQWMLAPTRSDGSAPRPDLRPQIINNSWAGDADDPWYTGYVAAWNAAGIFSSFAIGNHGLLGCSTAEAPGNYANAFGIGAVNSADQVTAFSGRGPTHAGLLKPDMTAPGADILSAWNDGSLRLLNGTSMASPHVAGVVALLWSANPALIGDLPATQELLTGAARPLYSTQCGDGATDRPNNVYGWGRLDALATLRQGVVDVPWLTLPATATLPASASSSVTIWVDARQVPGPGSFEAAVTVWAAGTLTNLPLQMTVTPAANLDLVQGVVRDTWTAAPIYSRLDLGSGPTVTAPAGDWSLLLPAGTYPLTVTAPGYLPQSTTLDTSQSAPLVTALLPDTPHAVLEQAAFTATLPFGGGATQTLHLANAGARPLTATLRVPPDEWSVRELPPANLYDLSAFAPLPLRDETVLTTSLKLGFSLPMFGGQLSEVYPASNGWIGSRFQWQAQPGPRCLPSTALPAGAFAPFWADLDPGAGGSVRAGTVAPGVFVVGYTDVPLWTSDSSPLAPRYTFQVVFKASGTIEYRYGAMDEPPANWVIGVAYNSQRGQAIACSARDDTRPGPRLELEAQTAASTWLAVEPAQLEIAPGATATFTVTLQGLGYAAWRQTPMRGTVQLTTSDPLQPTLRSPAELAVGAPPFRIWMPHLDR